MSSTDLFSFPPLESWGPVFEYRPVLFLSNASQIDLNSDADDKNLCPKIGHKTFSKNGR